MREFMPFTHSVAPHIPVIAYAGLGKTLLWHFSRGYIYLRCPGSWSPNLFWKKEYSELLAMRALYMTLRNPSPSNFCYNSPQAIWTSQQSLAAVSKHIPPPPAHISFPPYLKEWKLSHTWIFQAISIFIKALMLVLHWYYLMGYLRKYVFFQP